MSQTDSAPANRDKRKRIALLISGGLAVCVLLLVFACHFVGIHSTRDIVAYRAMWRDRYHPIWKDLALRRIKRGDDVESLLKKHTPPGRADAGPYTKLVYVWGGAYRRLTVMSKNGKLIAAVAGAATWRHVFFEAPEQGESSDQAQRNYLNRLRLECDAYRIHHAIAAGRDVFLSDHVERREAPGMAPGAKQDNEMMRQLREIYGDRYIQFVTGAREELVVEATEVLAGDLEPGTTLTFPKGACDDADLAEPQTVFLSRPRQAEIEYMTVPRSTLEWYQSLTQDQIQEFEARWSARQANLRRAQRSTE